MPTTIPVDVAELHWLLSESDTESPYWSAIREVIHLRRECAMQKTQIDVLRYKSDRLQDAIESAWQASEIADQASRDLTAAYNGLTAELDQVESEFDLLRLAYACCVSEKMRLKADNERLADDKLCLHELAVCWQDEAIKLSNLLVAIQIEAQKALEEREAERQQQKR